MKGFIENIQHYCLHDGAGIRTVVFLKGCPLRCLWCANPTTQERHAELLHHSDKCFRCGHCADVCPQHAVSRQDDHMCFDRTSCNACGLCLTDCPGKALQIAGSEREVDDILDDIKKDMHFYRNSGGGVTLSGGEVLSQPAFALEIMRACRHYGIHLAMETSGFGRRQDLLELVDMVSCLYFDIKHADSAIHRQLTGQGNEQIFDNLDAVLDTAADKLIVRLPLVPGCNDGEEDLTALAARLQELGRIRKMELLPYHRLGKNKYDLLGRDYRLESVEPMDKNRLADCGAFLKARLKTIDIFWR